MKATRRFLVLLLLLSAPPLRAAPTLSIERGGSNVVLRFEGRLQSAVTPQGPFTNVTGAVSPYAQGIDADAARFWRMESVLPDPNPGDRKSVV